MARSSLRVALRHFVGLSFTFGSRISSMFILLLLSATRVLARLLRGLSFIEFSSSPHHQQCEAGSGAGPAPQAAQGQN